jgi:hypothetical protein
MSALQTLYEKTRAETADRGESIEVAKPSASSVQFRVPVPVRDEDGLGALHVYCH